MPATVLFSGGELINLALCVRILDNHLLFLINLHDGEYIMSTNALVAYLREDNSVVSSYVHWDGYTTAVGEMLLEHYNLRVLARDLAEKLGYASSLRETIVASHEGRANSDEAITYESYEEFEEYIRDNSHLEYVYLWDLHKDKWMVASWETTRKQVHNGTCLDYEFESTWNGFEELVTVYVREGNETVERYETMVSEGRVGVEFLEHARELKDSVTKWMSIGMKGIVREVLAA